MRDEDFERLLRSGVDAGEPSDELVSDVVASLQARIDTDPDAGDPAEGEEQDLRVIEIPLQGEDLGGGTRRWIRGGLALAAAAAIIGGLILVDRREDDQSRVATTAAEPLSDDASASTTTIEPSPEGPDPDSTDVLATLAFSGGNVNLVVLAPDGEVVSDLALDPGGDPSPSGGLVAGDSVAPCGEGADEPLETYVYWPEGQAPSGNYAASISVVSGCDEGIDYTLDVSVKGENAGTDTGTITGRFDSSTPITFEVP